MPLPETHVKEQLSIAYVEAVAARAGVVCRRTTPPEYGVDLYLIHVAQLSNGKYAETGHLITCQVKATTTCEFRPAEVAYDMDVEAYNKLVTFVGGPCILVLLCLPPDPQEWLQLTEEQLILRKCCYWERVGGPVSQNAATQRLIIPRSQLFTPETVAQLLQDLRQGRL